jgi:hypothetical protein
MFSQRRIPGSIQFGYADAMKLHPRAIRILVLFSLPWTAPVRGAEMIGNGSFESISGPGQLPVSWTLQASAAGTAAQSSNTRARAGTWSARVTGRADESDGLRQSVMAALSAEGSGVRRFCRTWIWIDDVASVRVLLQYRDASGQRPDVILAEQVVRTPGQWTAVEGRSLITWSGALRSATIVIEVFQLSRSTTSLAARLLPDYYIDDLTWDTDTDGDGVLDREEAALGLSASKVDSDGDGLPDRWEVDHGFTPAINEASLDTDGDGFTNWQEYWAATDPRSAASFPGKPANPNLNPAAKSVLRWLALLPAQASGRHLAAGQHVTDLVSATEYPTMIDNLGASTGKFPAILSLAIEPGFDRFGLPLQMAEAESRALAYWQAGGLVLMKWAIYNPWAVLNANNTTGGDLPGLLNPANSTTASRSANQAAHDNLVSWMATVADALARLQQQGVVVMFRPCSEMNGSWFWWGRRERADYIALWRFLYDYFTRTRGLNNLIWVYESDAGTHAPVAAGGQGFASDYYYPGDDCVDVMGHNLYSDDWVLAWEANAIYARYPKVYGIPQAGPGRVLRDGTFNNLIYPTQSAALLPRSSFFIAWNSFAGTDPATQVQSVQKFAIVDNTNARALMDHPAVVTRGALPAVLFDGGTPVIATQPAARSVAPGASASFSVVATSPATLTYQWLFNAQPIAGATAASLTVNPVGPADVGPYTVRVSDTIDSVTSEAAILGLTATGKLTGLVTEVASNIAHANGNIYDQVLLEGNAAAVTADPGQVLRLSFVDLTDDIVQVEFSGAGTLALTLDNASGPALPAKYQQAVRYMKGHAGIVIAGANETTNLSVFSIGRITAVDQTLFRGDVAYDGLADLAYVAISSANGKFGGLRTANASYFATKGQTGIYAPGVTFTGPVFVGDIAASDTATPLLILGAGTDVRITGGDLLQANSRPVAVGGFTQLRYTSGTTSHGTTLPVLLNQGRLEQNGADVTTATAVQSGP